MKKFLFYFALTGFSLSLIVHIFSLAGVDLTEKVPFVWLLHIGIFVVWIPVVLDMIKSDELKEYRKTSMLNRMNPIGLYKIIFKETPTWMIIITAFCFIYAIINFMLFIDSQGGSPEYKDGQFILQNHGQIVKTITENEYHHYSANQVRGFSGHWLLFYSVSTALLYKYSGLSGKEMTL